MFVNIVEFPPLKPGADAAFRQWFQESNAVYQRFDGFVSRRLLKATNEGGGYAAIVEHASEATFMAMHTSPERQTLWANVAPLLEGSPKPAFYDVVELSSGVPVTG